MSKSVVYLYSGKLMSMRDISETIGRSYNLVVQLIRKSSIKSGHDVTSLIDDRREGGGRSGIKYIYQNQLMSIRDISDAVGLSYQLVCRLIRKASIRPDHDITSLIDDRNKVDQYIYQNKLMSVHDISNAVGLGYPHVRILINKSNIEPGNDVTGVIDDRLTKRGKQFIYQGKLMTIKEISEAVGLSYEFVSGLISKVSIGRGQDVTGVIDDRRKRLLAIKFVYQEGLMNTKQISILSGVKPSMISVIIRTCKHLGVDDFTSAINSFKKINNSGKK